MRGDGDEATKKQKVSAEPADAEPLAEGPPGDPFADCEEVQQNKTSSISLHAKCLVVEFALRLQSRGDATSIEKEVIATLPQVLPLSADRSLEDGHAWQFAKIFVSIVVFPAGNSEPYKRNFCPKVQRIIIRLNANEGGAPIIRTESQGVWIHEFWVQCLLIAGAFEFFSIRSCDVLRRDKSVLSYLFYKIFRGQAGAMEYFGQSQRPLPRPTSRRPLTY